MTTPDPTPSLARALAESLRKERPVTTPDLPQAAVDAAAQAINDEYTPLTAGTGQHGPGRTR